MTLGIAIISTVVLGAILFNMWFGWAVYYYSGKQPT
jgi:hypothetical protein